MEIRTVTKNTIMWKEGKNGEARGEGGGEKKLVLLG